MLKPCTLELDTANIRSMADMLREAATFRKEYMALKRLKIAFHKLFTCDLTKFCLFSSCVDVEVL